MGGSSQALALLAPRAGQLEGGQGSTLAHHPAQGHVACGLDPSLARVDEQGLSVCGGMELSDEAGPAAAEERDDLASSEPVIRPIRPIPSYPSPAAVDAGAMGQAVGRARRRSAMAGLLIRPCVLRCTGAHGDVFWV